MCTTTLADAFSEKCLLHPPHTQTLPADKLGFTFISHIDAAALHRKIADRKREKASKYRI